jgi:hypothetical protein
MLTISFNSYGNIQSLNTVSLNVMCHVMWEHNSDIVWSLPVYNKRYCLYVVSFIIVTTLASWQSYYSGVYKFSGEAVDIICAECCMFENLLYLTKWRGDLEKPHGNVIDNCHESNLTL